MSRGVLATIPPLDVLVTACSFVFPRPNFAALISICWPLSMVAITREFCRISICSFVFVIAVSFNFPVIGIRFVSASIDTLWDALSPSKLNVLLLRLAVGVLAMPTIRSS